jgi:hypothetical protein
MKIFVTSRQQATLDLWSGLLSASTVIGFVNDSDRKVQADAIVMSGVWAFDRYGGSPSREVAQVFSNMKDDGLPQWIVVPPFRPIVKRSSGEFDIRDDFVNISPAYFGILESLRAARREFGNCCTVEFNLPLLGMDDPRDSSTPSSVSDAIQKFITESS